MVALGKRFGEYFFLFLGGIVMKYFILIYRFLMFYYNLLIL